MKKIYLASIVLLVLSLVGCDLIFPVETDDDNKVSSNYEEPDPVDPIIGEWMYSNNYTVDGYGYTAVETLEFKESNVVSLDSFIRENLSNTHYVYQGTGSYTKGDTSLSLTINLTRNDLSEADTIYINGNYSISDSVLTLVINGDVFYYYKQ